MHACLSSVELLDFDATLHVPLVEGWLARPHVARWWGDAGEALTAVRRHSSTTQALIGVDARPVGYLCWQSASPEELAEAGLGDLPVDLVDVDILIGEADCLGLGIGPQALRLLLDRLRAAGLSSVGMATAAANLRARRAFEKAGFHLFRTFREGGEDMAYLVRSLEDPG